MTQKCVFVVDAQLTQIDDVKSKLTGCLQVSPKTMKLKFNNGVDEKLEWNIYDQVFLVRKFSFRLLAPFPNSHQVPTSAYKLIPSHFIKRVQPVFHVTVLFTYQPYLVMEKI